MVGHECLRRMELTLCRSASSWVFLQRPYAFWHQPWKHGMFDVIKSIYNFIRSRTEAQVAEATARVFAPFAFLFIAVSGVYSPASGLVFGKPLVVSNLRSEVDENGAIIGFSGVTLTLDPVDAEYRIPIATAKSMWTSLDETT